MKTESLSYLSRSHREQKVDDPHKLTRNKGELSLVSSETIGLVVANEREETEPPRWCGFFVPDKVERVEAIAKRS